MAPQHILFNYVKRHFYISLFCFYTQNNAARKYEKWLMRGFEAEPFQVGQMHIYALCVDVHEYEMRLRSMRLYCAL